MLRLRTSHSDQARAMIDLLKPMQLVNKRRDYVPMVNIGCLLR